MRLTGIVALAAATALSLTACTSGGSDGKDENSSTPGGGETKSAGSSAGQKGKAAPAVTDEDRKQAKDIVARMDDAQLAGAVIMADYQGTDPAAGAKLIKDEHLAGLIVMGYNLSDSPTADEVKKATGSLSEAAGDRGWPTVLGVDQEGGPVARLGSAATRFPPMMAAGAAHNPQVTQAATRAQGSEIRDLGFTADFAPDSDVTIGKQDAAINVRSPGSSPALVGQTAAAAVRGYTQAGLASSAKHFPGHGALTVDSHEGLPVSKKSIAQMDKRDLEPFRDAKKAGVPMVLVGHIGLPGATNLPGTLNPKVYESLRKDIGFDGVAITDALNMGAIHEPEGQETVKAIKAGADLALMPPKPTAAAHGVRDAMKSGSLPKKRVQEAATRVIAMQLWQQRNAHAVAGDSVDVDKAFSTLADKSLTVLKGTCKARPAKAISITGGEESARQALEKAARKEGLTTGSGTSVSLSPQSSADVVVGTGAPWKVSGSKAKTIINVYSDNPHAMGAVAKYLAGNLRATARSPVKVAGTPPTCGKS